MLPHSAGLQGAPQFHPAKAICAQVAVLQSLSVGLLVWLSSMRPGLLFFFFLQSRTLSCFLLYSFSISCNLFLAVNHAGKNMLCFFFIFLFIFYFFLIFKIQSPVKAVLMLTFLPREPELSAWGPAVRPGCERGDLTHFMAVALILD